MFFPEEYDPDPFAEEVRIFLHTALDDIRFFRTLAKRVGKPERERLDEVGFAYGDDSILGGDPFDAHQYKLATVVHTLFGEGYATDLHLYSYDEADFLTNNLYALDGAEVGFEGGGPNADEEEGVLAVEIRSCAETTVESIIRALHKSRAGSAPYRLYRWRPESTHSHNLAAASHFAHEVGHYPEQHFLMIFAEEIHDLQETFNTVIFERLICAWEHMSADERAAGPAAASEQPDSSARPA